jgi:hypothetical protein
VNGAGLRVIPAFAGMTWQRDAITLTEAYRLGACPFAT